MMTLIIVTSWALIKQLAVIQEHVSGCFSVDLAKIANKGKYYWPELSHNRTTMRRQTRLDHEERMEAAIRYIVEHLDEPVDLRDLAEHVCLSRFYFHRLFQALIGETVGELVRRLRLQRAATRLRTSDTPITELAFEAGYAT